MHPMPPPPRSPSYPCPSETRNISQIQLIKTNSIKRHEILDGPSETRQVEWSRVESEARAFCLCDVRGLLVFGSARQAATVWVALIGQHNPLKLHIVYTKNQFAKVFWYYKCQVSHRLGKRKFRIQLRPTERPSDQATKRPSTKRPNANAHPHPHILRALTPYGFGFASKPTLMTINFACGVCCWCPTPIG